MAFSKFDPHKEVQPEEDSVGDRRAFLLKVGSWVTFAYTMLGFLFIGIILVRGRLF